MLDDSIHFQNDQSLTSHSVESLLTEGTFGFYRPISSLVQKTILHLSGTAPFGYHLFNLFLFYAACVLFFILLSQLFKNRELAFIAACLFAVHPINGFLVNYKTACGLLSFLLLMQMSALFFLNYLDHKRKINYASSLALYSLALFSHEMSFMLPLYLFLAMVLVKKNSFKESLLLTLPFIPILLTYLGFRSIISGVNQVDNFFGVGISFPEVLATNTRLVYWYISKLLVPTNIIFLWNEEISKLLELKHLLLWIILSGGCLGILITKRRDVYAFGFLLFLVGLSPIGLASLTYASNNHTALLEPHWFSFPSIGFFAVLSASIVQIKHLMPHKVWISCVCIFIISLSLFTRMTNKVWESEESYCTYWITVNPINPTPWLQLSESYFENYTSGVSTPVTDMINKSLEEKPSPFAFLLRGSILSHSGSTDLALLDFNRSLQLKEHHLSFVARANLFVKLKQYEPAIEDYGQALTLKPDLKEVYLLRGFAYQLQKKFELAIEEYDQALTLKPDWKEAYLLRGATYQLQKRFELALDEINRAIELDSFYPEAYARRSELHFEERRFDQALSDALIAKGMGYEISQEYIDYLRNPSGR